MLATRRLLLSRASIGYQLAERKLPPDYLNESPTTWPSCRLDLLEGPVHCVVAEVMCRYHSSVAFPDRITVGIRAARIGSSSVRYEIGVFRNDDDVAAAEGYFVHVFVDRATQRPVPVPEASREALQAIAI